jgi:hypothetical protein
MSLQKYPAIADRFGWLASVTNEFTLARDSANEWFENYAGPDEIKGLTGAEIEAMRRGDVVWSLTVAFPAPTGVRTWYALTAAEAIDKAAGGWPSNTAP